MNEEELIAHNLTRLFERHIPGADRSWLDERAWSGDAWRAFEEAGLAHPGRDAERGGADLGLEVECLVARIAGVHAAPLPLVETMVAGHALAAAGLTVPDGAITLGFVCDGVADRVAWDGFAGHVVLLSDIEGQAFAALLPVSGFEPEIGLNLADEPRARLRAPAGEGGVPTGLSVIHFRAHGALLRAAQIAGGIQRALALSVAYANTRKQFGQPIGKFQAIQQQLAVMAEEGAAALSAVASAARIGTASENFILHAGIAKARAGEAARHASAISHQVHGAIGFAMEHELQFVTRRLLAWRSEFGNDRTWQEEIGRRAMANGGEALWPMLCK